MFGFSKDQLEQNKQELAAMKDSIMSALKDMMSHVSTENAITRKMVTDFVAEERAKIIMDERTMSQQDVIESGGGGSGGGTSFSIRYRNGTAETPPVDIHRLEWIAKSSVYDPALLAAAGKTEADAIALGYAGSYQWMWATGWVTITDAVVL